jgi:hypothetical protein
MFRVGQPILAAAAFQAACSGRGCPGFHRKRRCRRGSSSARVNALGPRARLAPENLSRTISESHRISGKRQGWRAAPFIERGNIGARNRETKTTGRQGRKIIAAVPAGRFAPISHSLRSKTRTHERRTIPEGSVSCDGNQGIRGRSKPPERRLQPGLAAPLRAALPVPRCPR